MEATLRNGRHFWNFIHAKMLEMILHIWIYQWLCDIVWKTLHLIFWTAWKFVQILHFWQPFWKKWPPFWICTQNKIMKMVLHTSSYKYIDIFTKTLLDFRSTWTFVQTLYFFRQPFWRNDRHFEFAFIPKCWKWFLMNPVIHSWYFYKDSTEFVGVHALL